jgi:glycosyltransferase involved in cell wall biosynthesis
MLSKARPALLVAPEPLFRSSGTPMNVMLMCRALCESGLAVEVAALPGGSGDAIAGMTLRRMPRLPLIGAIPIGFSFAKLFYNLLLAGTVVGLLLRRRYLVVHAVEEAALYAVPLARLFRVPAVIDLDSDLAMQLREHRSRLVRALAGPTRVLRRRALRQAAAAVTVARHISRVVAHESPRTPVYEITDIPIEDAMRPPDPERMAAYRTELGLEGRRLVVYTGNCEPRQGLDELVRAMPEVLRCHPEAVLLIVGGEPAELRGLQQLVDQLGIGQGVRLIGPRPRATMAEYMGMAETLVSPRREPYVTPFKIFSYMASGRPIVATDLETHTVVLDQTSAILVPPTAAGLAAGILRALSDPAAAELGRRAARLVEEKHSYEQFRRQLVQVYEAFL